MKTLVAGWFSFEGMGASAGDLIARDLARDWLRRAGQPYDVALAPPFGGGVDWRVVDPGTYSGVVFVCGPFGNGKPLRQFLKRFAGCRLVGLNLTMLTSLEVWNPFDLLWERDSSRCTRPDIAFGSCEPLVPRVGLILIDTQPEYGARDVHAQANAAIERALERRAAARVRIDTRLDVANVLRTPAEVESLIAGMDLVVTTRLHGLVLALKQGVPAVAIDPVRRGGKVTRQAAALDWPLVLMGESLSDDDLAEALSRGLAPDARERARACRDRAVAHVQRIRDEFVAELRAARP